jgi:hypothetical protein
MALPFSRCMHVNKMLKQEQLGLEEDLYQNVMENVPMKRLLPLKSN